MNNPSGFYLERATPESSPRCFPLHHGLMALDASFNIGAFFFTTESVIICYFQVNQKKKR